MYCLNPKTGDPIWRAPASCVSSPPVRLACTPSTDWDASWCSTPKTVLASTHSPPSSFPSNCSTPTRTASSWPTTGLIQCLHEVELSQPLVHGKDRKLAAVEAEKPAKKEHGAAGQGRVQKRRLRCTRTQSQEGRQEGGGTSRRRTGKIAGTLGASIDAKSSRHIPCAVSRAFPVCVTVYRSVWVMAGFGADCRLSLRESRRHFRGAKGDFQRPVNAYPSAC